VRIPDSLEEELRRKLPAKRGVLSKFVREAIEEKLKNYEYGDDDG